MWKKLSYGLLQSKTKVGTALTCWNSSNQGRRNIFQSAGAMEHWKVLGTTMVGRQEKIWLKQ